MAALTTGRTAEGISAHEVEWWIVRNDTPDEPFVTCGTGPEAREAVTNLRARHPKHTFEVFEVYVIYTGKRLDW